MINETTYKIPISEKVCVLVEHTLDKFLKIPAFQRYVNRKGSDKCGLKLISYSGNGSVDDVMKDYNFNDIQRDDIVLDIGANVGGFSLFVSRFVKQVYAVEPMIYEILGHNVINNNKENITILPEALGEGTVKIGWEGCRDRCVNCKSLSELINLCGGKVDFLKCDCEGGEWCIKPHELKGIRRIEIEVHNFDGTHKLEDFLKMLDKAGFEYEYTSPRQGILIVHARNKFF